MDPIIFRKLILSGIMLLLIYAFFQILKFSAKNTQKKFGIRKSRYFAIRRLLTMSSLFLTLAMLFLIWDVTLKNVWISMTSILAVTAIAFFAIWSLVGNILAGIILYFTSPFKTNDVIEVMPDGICGTVLAINTFYTILMDEKENYINVPNSLFFQKYIQVKKTKHRTPVAPPPDESKESAHG